MAFQVGSGMARRSLRRSMKLLGQNEQVRLQNEVVSTSICSTKRLKRDTASPWPTERLRWAGSILRPFRITAAIDRSFDWAIRRGAEARGPGTRISCRLLWWSSQYSALYQRARL